MGRLHLEPHPSRPAEDGEHLRMTAHQREQRDSPLTLRAPERRSPVLHKTLHDPRAAIRFTFLALVVVDLKRMLEIAEFAGGLAVVAQRRAAGVNGLIEHGVNDAHPLHQYRTNTSEMPH
jgi:hypothetical protein